MSRWPWPDTEVAWFMARSRRVMDGHPRRDRLIQTLMVHLATHDHGGGPVRDLAAWAKKHSTGRLREHIETFDAPDIRHFAETQAGAPRRRGDLIQIRSKPRWWDIRTK